METTIMINGNILHAIPAIHGRSVFANEVNRQCSQKATRPDAIAVELGANMVQEIVAWMKEMGIGQTDRVILPCMVGLVVDNHLIHPGFRTTTDLLKQRYSMPLRVMPPEMLKHFLYFSGKKVLGLSGTDSIVEAIRCAIELDIPVYGVDMDEYAAGKEEQCLVEDPEGSRFDLEQFVKMNGRQAARLCDPYIDRRREAVMAARLKSVLAMHRRVLFTGGLAHWGRLKELLNDSKISPAEIMAPEHPVKITRVILHPFIALRFMDLYPILGTFYEKNRINPRLGSKKQVQLPDAGPLLRRILDKTYRIFAREASKGNLDGPRIHDYAIIPEFEKLLDKARLVARRINPPMSLILEVSESMMPLDFTKKLASGLMDIGRSWASQEQFPGLPVVSEVSPVDNAGNYEENIQQCVLSGIEPEENLYGSSSKARSDPFTVRFLHGNRTRNHIPRYWHWKDEPEEWRNSQWSPAWMWPPCEALLYGMATYAAKKAVHRSKETNPAPFEGSLYNGIDTRATMRSVITGENRVYIRKPFVTMKTVIPDGKSPEPTVFIFCSPREAENSSWTVLVGGYEIGNFIKNRSRFEQVTRQYGSNFISSIALDHSVKVPGSLRPHVDGMNILDGITLFGNPCINARQSAQWVEDNDFTCCPVSGSVTFTGLSREYKSRYRMDIDKEDWQTALIQFALPFAKERLVVVAPVNFQLSRKLLSEVKRMKKDLALVPLNSFPVAKIAEMRKRILTRSSDPDGCRFPRETEIALGQSAEKYRNLLPVYMQNQLKTK